jgi:sec-independent protein translocase protein TatB
MPDTLFILVLALVIFGPKRLPEIARQLAKFLGQFRTMRDELKHQMENELLKFELEAKDKKPSVAPEQPRIATHSAAESPLPPTQALPQSPVS